jgi:predicted Rdx family selenoprotein
MNQASRIGIAAFVVPFMFVYSPALLMQGSLWDIVRASLSAGLGLACLSISLTGYGWRDLRAWERMGLLAASALLIFDQWMLDLAGALIAALLLVPQWLSNRRNGVEPDRWSDEDRTAIAQWMAREALPAPAHDLTRFAAWLPMVGVAFIIGAMGDQAWHSRQIEGWLAGLAVCTALILLSLDLERHLSAQREGDSVE